MPQRKTEPTPDWDHSYQGPCRPAHQAELTKDGVFCFDGSYKYELPVDDHYLCPGWYYCIRLGDSEHFATIDPIGPFRSKAEATREARKAARQAVMG